MLCINQFWDMAEKGHIWQNWDTKVAIHLFTPVNTRLHFLSKTLWAMIYKTSTYIIELLSLLQLSQQTFYFNFSKRMVEYRQFTLTYSVSQCAKNPKLFKTWGHAQHTFHISLQIPQLFHYKNFRYQ